MINPIDHAISLLLYCLGIQFAKIPLVILVPILIKEAGSFLSLV